MMEFFNRTYLISIIFCVIWRSCSSENTTNLECSNDHSSLSYIVNNFSSHLSSNMDRNSSTNFFFSPFSISLSLAMAYLGARGSTAENMDNALGYKELQSSNKTIHHLFKEALVALGGARDYTLEVADGLFAQKNYKILPPFVEGLQKNYDTHVQYVDFADDSQQTLERINNWVNSHTNGTIEKLLYEPLDPLTRLAIMNAIYFKGFWSEPFDERMTRKRHFFKLNGDILDVDFMDGKKKTNYFHDHELGYRFLELSYKGNGTSMIIALPDDRREFPSLEMTDDVLCHIMDSISEYTMHIRIPRFKMTYEREMSRDLMSLGLEELFSEEKADFSGMRAERDIFLSSIFHKAVITVNEKGSEAAAVNDMVFQSRSGFMGDNRFYANHPFLFYILDNHSGSVLFMGRLMDPLSPGETHDHSGCKK